MTPRKTEPYHQITNALVPVVDIDFLDVRAVVAVVVSIRARRTSTMRLVRDLASIALGWRPNRLTGQDLDQSFVGRPAHSGGAVRASSSRRAM